MTCHHIERFLLLSTAYGVLNKNILLGRMHPEQKVIDHCHDKECHTNYRQLGIFKLQVDHYVRKRT